MSGRRPIQGVNIEAAGQCSPFMIEEVRKMWVTLAVLKKMADEAIEVLLKAEGRDRINGQDLECECVESVIAEVINKSMLAALSCEAVLEAIGQQYERLEDHLEIDVDDSRVKLLGQDAAENILEVLKGLQGATPGDDVH